MKYILVTGVNSYIGNKFSEWVSHWPDRYSVTKVSLKSNEWKKMDWSSFDIILNVSGIAHRKVTKENIDLFFKVNSELPYEIAEKAIESGVNHLIHLSSMSVFGMNNGNITQRTVKKPSSPYGVSKLKGDNKILEINPKHLKVTIIRPPMVYGKDSPGNYAKLSSLSRNFFIFPNYENQRSMIFIDNLSEFIRQIIEFEKSGIYYPQNQQ